MKLTVQEDKLTVTETFTASLDLNVLLKKYFTPRFKHFNPFIVPKAPIARQKST